MPSCNGGRSHSSNCSSNCNCSTVYVDREVKVHLDEKERKQFQNKIKELEEELKSQRKMNTQLVERLLEERRL